MSKPLSNNLAIAEISLSEMMNAKRFDAEYFDTDYIELDRRLAQITTTSIADYVTISDGNHLSISDQFTVGPKTIPYLRGQDIKNVFIDDSTAIRVPENIY